jgi:alpha-L-rhamnosidase
MNSTLFSLSDLRCDARVDPLGTGDAPPNLSWKLSTSEPSYRGLRQAAYRVRVASRPELLGASPDLWDSGEVASDQSVGGSLWRSVAYFGSTRLLERFRYERSRRDGNKRTAFWEFGLLNRSDWEPARWISGELVGGPRTTVPLPYLRRSFALTDVPQNARLHITALGLYRVYINGVRVGDDELTPGWTDYRKRVQYQTYDVSALLQPARTLSRLCWGTAGTPGTSNGAGGNDMATDRNFWRR